MTYSFGQSDDANTNNGGETENVHGGWLVAKMLRREGISTVFTLSGGHIAPIYDGCVREAIRVVDMRHEQSAVHAAEGWARVTGGCGVALLTAGPGVTDGVTGVANAFQAPSPIIVLGGRSPLSQDGMGGLQEIDQTGIMRPITKMARTVYETRRIPQYMADAFRYALSGKPGPVFLDFPFDVLSNIIPTGDVTKIADGYRIKNGAYEANPRLVDEAAELLADADRPVIMAGGAVWWCQATTALRELASALQAPVFLNGMGRGLLPGDDPLFFNLCRKTALQNADVALLIGTPLDFRLNFGDSFGKQTKIIWVDIDPEEIGANRSPAVGLAGDVRLTLEQLGIALDLRSSQAKERAHGTVRQEWLRLLREAEAKAYAKDEAMMNSDSIPIHPLRLCREIRDFLDRDATVVGDGGDIVTFGARVIRANEPAHWLDPGQMGCLGVGPGFAIAAKLARPNKQVLLLSGDGSFGLNGMEFDTMVRHKLPVVCVIGNDGAWGQIKHPQVQFFGHATAADLAPAIRYDKVVEALGGYGELVEKPEDIRPALERAFASGLPACVNVLTDPKVSYTRGSVIGL